MPIDKKTAALMVIAADPRIRRLLSQNDPMALKQVEEALGNRKPTPETHPQTFAEPDLNDLPLSLLMDKLPKQDGDVYFELRKREEEYCCAKVNYATNRDFATNYGPTPEIAVSKMLKRIAGEDF